MQLNCPCCHARFPLEAALQDDAARDVMGLIGPMDASLARLLITYIGFFRAGGRSLAWDRALKLMRTAVELAPPQLLEPALVEANASLDEKRAQAGWVPLAGHNYLKRVIESTEARLGAAAAVAVTRQDARPLPQSKTGQAMAVLQGSKRG
jgi:hypothetical protein